MDVREAIEHSYLADGMTSEFIDRLASIARQKTFKSGDAIMHQFDEDRDLLLIQCGSARILAVTGETIGEVGPGSVLGEIALIDGKSRAATVISEGPCKVIIFPEESLLKIFKQDIGMMNLVLLNLCRTLCARMRSSNQYMAMLLALQENPVPHLRS